MTDVERLTERLVARLVRLGAERQLAELEHLKQVAEGYGTDFQKNEIGTGLLAMEALLVARINTAQPHHRRPKSLTRDQLRVACRSIILALKETGHLHNGSILQ